MPIYSKYTGVGGGTTYTFVGVAPVTVTDLAGTVTVSMTQADATTDGWLSFTDWNTFNSKQSALTFGNLTEATSSVLTISGGTGAVIGSGTTIQVTQAGAATSGYLSSTDWNTFNNKVSSVGASAPLSSSGGTTPSISISQASALTDGYLSSTDWSTFNSKQNALTFGNLTGDTNANISISGGTGAVIGAGTSISQSAASALSNGYLTSSDWSTFNSKQPAGNYITALTGEVTATGPGSVTATIAGQSGNLDKVLSTNGTAVTWQYAGLGSGAFGTNNVVVGRSKPSFTSAANVTLVGATSGNAITSGTQHTCLGSGSGGAALIAGTNSTAVGYNALVTGATPSNAVAIGANSSAGGDATFGGTAIGANSIADNQSVAVGKSAVAQNARNVSIGRGTNTGSASDGICIGSNITLSNSGILIAAAGAAQTQSVANSIGLYAACQVANSILLGQSRNIYFNNHGVQRAAVPALSENQIFTNSYSTGGATNNGDASGGILSINGAQGTGTGIGGDIRFRTSPPGAVSNNVQNALVEQVRITYDGKLGVGTSAPAVLVHAQQTSAATNTVTNVLRVDSQSSGTPATGIGVGIQMAAETSVGNTEIGVVLEAVTTDVTAASEDFDLVVKNMAAGAAATETLRITSTGDTKVVQGQLSVETAGKGLSVKEGTNAKIGVTGAFPGGGANTVTVSTTAVTANSIIFISAVSGATTIDPKIWVSTITAGTSFVISSGDNSFVGTVGWMIVERLP